MTDYFANALFAPGTGALLQRREVAGASTLSRTSPGWGVKVGLGYYDGMDWVGAEPTLLYVLAAAWNGLPGLAEVQYDAGLRLQCPSGAFGVQEHPPVGPQTGTFQSPPQCNQPDPGPTALVLLATHALFGLRADVAGRVRTSPGLPAPWRSATLLLGTAGRTVVVRGVPAVDAVVRFHRRRVAVVVTTANGVESGLELGVAYEALRRSHTARASK